MELIMKRNVLIIGFIGLLMLAILAGGIWLLGSGEAADAATVDAANQLYVSGHYGEAARIYEQELARGVQDSAIYFNLGNAYFQQGDMGRAVLNLQRAAELAPRDDDIQANLELARQQTTELFAAEPTLLKADYARWMLEDPRDNYAVRTRGGPPGGAHHGLQAEDRTQLEAVYERGERAGRPVLDQGETTYCY